MKNINKANSYSSSECDSPLVRSMTSGYRSFIIYGRHGFVLQSRGRVVDVGRALVQHLVGGSGLVAGERSLSCCNSKCSLSLSISFRISSSSSKYNIDPSSNFSSRIFACQRNSSASGLSPHQNIDPKANGSQFTLVGFSSLIKKSDQQNEPL